MPRRNNYDQSNFDPYTEKIKKLEEDLWSARYTIIHLMPEEIQSILESFYSCKSSSATYAWANTTARETTSFAKTLSPEEGSGWSNRAYCPLCGDGARSYYERGFSIPEGLFRHLVGWGNANQCRVFEAATKLARDYGHREFRRTQKSEK